MDIVWWNFAFSIYYAENEILVKFPMYVLVEVLYALYPSRKALDGF